MKRYFIEEVKCGVTAGGMACGPVGGDVVASVKFTEGKKKAKWLTMVEVTGILNVFLADRDDFDKILLDDFDEEFTEYMNEHAISDFNGIEFGEDYSDSFYSMAEDPENPAIPLIKYLFALMRCSMEETEDLVKKAKGKYADELDIPVTDVEEDWIADNEEEEDE